MSCSYKTLVVNLNRFANIAGVILTLILKMNRDNKHQIKHIDSPSIPVCLFKNADNHKTMKQFTVCSKNKHGTYFGLKLNLIADYDRKILRIFFTPANVDDRTQFQKSENVSWVHHESSAFICWIFRQLYNSIILCWKEQLTPFHHRIIADHGLFCYPL